MFGSNSETKDHWNLEEGDLPSAELLAREPRLRGMEENPVYRAIIHRRKLGRSWQARAGNPAFAIPTVLFFVLMQWLPPGWLHSLVLIGGIMLIRRLETIVGKGRDDSTDPLGENLTRTLRADSILAGVPPREAAKAAWAAQLSAKAVRTNRRLCVAVLAISLLAAIVLPARFASWMLYFPLVLMMVVLSAGYYCYLLNPVAPALRRIALATRKIREGAEWRNQPKRAARRAAGRTGNLILRGVILLCALPVAAVPLIIGIRFVITPVISPLHLAVVYVFVAVSAAIAAAYGRGKCQAFERDIDILFAEACGNYVWLTERLREEEFEAAGSGTRWGIEFRYGPIRRLPCRFRSDE